MNTRTALPQDFSSLLDKTRQCSRYAARILQAEPDLLTWLEKNHSTPCDRAEITALLEQSDGDLQDELRLTRAIRVLRKKVMLKLILRDLNGLANLQEVMQAMTALAEVCVQRAQNCLMSVLQQQHGTPMGEHSKTPQQMLVLGMGKLGGCELNVSSDIDLIFVYAEDGETQKTHHQDSIRTLGNHEFFTRLGRRLINMINEPTADGYVFRVDMRLRPYGDSGPLVMSFAALEEYLITQGREWERYAWIKARVISPVAAASEAELMRMTQPFVFRKYLDFGAIDSMRKLHAQIRQEVQRRDRRNNIKLGPGGIREIEFTAQVFQLIRGGREAKLRIRPTLAVLQQLAQDGELPKQTVAELEVAYVFLRNLEHRLQYLDDQQTQDIPETDDERTLLATGMGHAGYTEMLAQLDTYRAIVSAQFDSIFGEQASTPADVVWRDGMHAEDLAQCLGALSYQNVSGSCERLMQLREGNRYQQSSELSRQRVDQLVPQFIKLCAQQSDPDTTLGRMLSLLDGIIRRSSYLAFLIEYPVALQRLCHLLAASSWAAEYLTLHPVLFDELLDAREIYAPPDWSHLDDNVSARLAECDGDMERQMDVLRQFQQEQIFHLLAMDLQGLLVLEKLSDHLSDLADLLLRHVLDVCWNNGRKKHCETPKFAIIAYGKLGGKELGYESDLDLIFIYDDAHPDAQENYARLAQRINTVLGSYTSSGRLYETDLRLRPNGASGLLVTSIAAFADYQRNQAWVWEHQALTRARFCAGDTGIGKAFEEIRKDVLCLERSPKALRDEVLSMRTKMHEGHINTSQLFDIKHDQGGMVDIEFIVQYLVLAHAHAHPQLTGNVGNLALLKLAGDLRLIPMELAWRVGDLYRILRRTQHSMRLNHQSPCRVERATIDTTASLLLWTKVLAEN